MTNLSLRGWAQREQLLQIGTDYRAAVGLIDRQGWSKYGTDDDSAISATQAIGIIVGAGGDSFAGRATLALSACYRVTGLLLPIVNDKAQNWADLKTIMLGIARDCEDAAYRTGTSA